ncbi:MAG TPA: Gmad2 immunoglobulin-like domain-containing protein [Anaerolineales bacterium]|nr:Gmad2 immunoglobulin-like domain-containing protein [Anaerolineales bacterium]
MNSKPRKPFALFSLLALSLIASACSLLASSSSFLTPSPVESAFAPGNPTAAPPLDLTHWAITQTAIHSASPTTQPSNRLTTESTLILSPGPDSQITSPVTITGISNPAFEQRLSIQILDEAGSVLVSDGVTINASLGERGPFEATIEFEPPAQPQHGRIIVFDLSPRDGHISHLASVPVTLLPAGAPADIKPGQEHPEDIVVLSPAPQEIVGGGTVHVSGFAAPVFEQTLSVTVVDLIGAVVGSGTLTLQAEAGQPGRFESDLMYVVTEEQQGSIQVYATSPRDGGIIHLASVGVALRP